MWKLDLVHLEVVLVSAQDRRNIGAQFALSVQKARKSFCAQPMVLLRDVGQVETCYGRIGISVNLHAR